MCFVAILITLRQASPLFPEHGFFGQTRIFTSIQVEKQQQGKDDAEENISESIDVGETFN